MKRALTQDDRRRALLLLTGDELAEFNRLTNAAEKAAGELRAAELARGFASKTLRRAVKAARERGDLAIREPGYALMRSALDRAKERKRAARSAEKKARRMAESLLRAALKRERAGKYFRSAARGMQGRGAE